MALAASRGPALEPLPLGAVRPRGWMLAQMRRDLDEGFAGCLDRLTPHAARDLFRERIPSSSDPTAWWDAETRGNWLWGYVMMAHLAGLPEQAARAAALVADLAASRDADGYVGIYPPDARYRHGEGENGELWAQSRALLPLLAHHEATGDEAALAVVRGAVDLTLRQYGEGRPYFRRGGAVLRDALTGLTHGLCYLDVLEWLHDHTGAAPYAAAGLRLYEEFSAMRRPFPNDDVALPNVADPRQLFSGHAVHTAEHLRALLWVSRLAPARVPDALVERALARVALYRVPSGALIGDEGIHGQPMPESGYEHCTTAELAFSLSSAMQKLGSADLGDWLETLVLNAAQGARLPDGRAVAYLSADTRLLATAARADSYSMGAAGLRYKYSPTHDDVACCCSPNAVRLLPQHVSRMWMRTAGGRGLAAVAYGPCEVRTAVGGVDVTVVEETAYPFEDGVALTITPGRPLDFTLALRRPAWAGTMEVAAPGAEVTDADGWVRLRKLWKPGDRCHVTFSWRVRAEPYANGEVAVLRGPLQFALPVEPRLEPTRDYPIAGFHDYDVRPTSVAAGYRIPVLDAAAPDLGLTFEARGGGETNYPWDAPRCLLRSGDQFLVPLGCTILRRSAFPMR